MINLVNCVATSYETSMCQKVCAPSDDCKQCGSGKITKRPMEMIMAANGGKECDIIYEPCDLGDCNGKFR